MRFIMNKIVYNKRFLILILILLLVIIVICLIIFFRPMIFGNKSPILNPSYFPTKEWQTSTPEEQGFDSAKLSEGLSEISKKDLNIHSLLFIRNGKIFLDAYFYPYDGETVHELASVTKSIMTTLIAIAESQGKLKLEDKMLSFFPAGSIANLDERKKRITVKHLTSMSAGLESVGFERYEGTLEDMRANSNWIKFAVDRKSVFEPGNKFIYDSPGMHILSAILQNSTGKTSFEFAKEYLFEPLGIKEAIWASDGQGYTFGWGDLYLHPRDAAKIGYLWLNNGNWENKQIVPAKWVKESVKIQMKTGRGDYYGNGWWISPENNGNFIASGRGGQFIRVFPSMNLIAVTTGGGLDWDKITPFIVPAIIDLKKPLPENKAAYAKLNEILSDIKKAPPEKKIDRMPPIAEKISDRIYNLDSNPYSLKSVKFIFKNGITADAELIFSNKEPDRILEIGLDGIYRFSPGVNNLKSGQRGYWIGEDTFIFEYNLIANIDCFLLKIKFEGDNIKIEIKEKSNGSLVNTEGRI
jgi:CubicO group peptidase (beta-lactamase class C family)